MVVEGAKEGAWEKSLVLNDWKINDFAANSSAAVRLVDLLVKENTKRNVFEGKMVRRGEVLEIGLVSVGLLAESFDHERFY